MKRILTTVLIGMLILITCAFNQEEQKVYDEAGLLQSEQAETLQADAVKIAKAYEVDVIIVLIDDAQGMTSADYGEAFYRDHSFGYERAGGSGIMLLVDMDNRIAQLFTYGIADSEYTDAEIERMYDGLTALLKDSNYYGACKEFLSGVKEYGDRKTLSAGNLGVYLLMALVLSGVIVFIMKKSTGHKSPEAMRRSYASQERRILQQQDRYIRTTVTRVPRPKPNQGGGSHGGGGHGGRSGGGGARGGGRSF